MGAPKRDFAWLVHSLPYKRESYRGIFPLSVYGEGKPKEVRFTFHPLLFVKRELERELNDFLTP
jgi:hypothetical protein